MSICLRCKNYWSGNFCMPWNGSYYRGIFPFILLNLYVRYYCSNHPVFRHISRINGTRGCWRKNYLPERDLISRFIRGPVATSVLLRQVTVDKVKETLPWPERFCLPVGTLFGFPFETCSPAGASSEFVEAALFLCSATISEASQGAFWSPVFKKN